jgi:vacuolar-type H+-ATPase subunit H
MKETVDRILKEEESARTRIENAQFEADSIILKAREESKSLTEDMIYKASSRADLKKEEEERRFLSEKERILKEAREDAAIMRKEKEGDIPRIAEEIFLDITNTKD